MKNYFKKRIVDERMELQSLRNAKKAWTLALILFGVSILVKLFVLNQDISYIMTELCILMVASVYNIILDVKDGNIYTSDSSNPKRNLIMYITSSAIVGIFSGVGSGSLPLGIILGSITFAFTFSLMIVLDRILFHYGKKKADKASSDDE